MQITKYGIPVYNSHDLFKLIYQGNHKNLDNIHVFSSEDINIFQDISQIPLKIYTESNLTQQDFDRQMQQAWFMPEEYKNLDIEAHVLSITPQSQEQLVRVEEELQEFKSRQMLDILRWLKYFVDTCDQHNVVWGVGRGSSVSSYVLFLLGVHHIDSLKYNLDWREFLR